MVRNNPPFVEIIDHPWPSSSQCNHCKHYEGWGLCKAFPEGIPTDIIVDKVIHDEEIDGQVGHWVYATKPMSN